MTFKNGRVNEKMMKNDEKKKCHLKNDKLKHVLLYHFLNDENPTEIVSPGKKKMIWPHALKHEWMEAAFAVLIFVHTPRKKAWIDFFKLFNY